MALWQARFVQDELKKLGHPSEISIIKTQGDKIQNLSFDKLEGKGFFTKEIEDALLSGTIDVAVHSHKDLPTENPEGLDVAAVSYREDPADLLVINQHAYEEGSPLNILPGSRVGTSSFRRKSQLHAVRPDLNIDDLRGNVPTRLQKLRNGQYDAIILALAGVTRLELDLGEFVAVRLDPRDMVPAQSQGVLAFQVRADNTEVKEIFAKMNHADVAEVIGVERRILNKLDGGCLLPLGVFCEKQGDTFKLSCSYSKVWEDFPQRATLLGNDPHQLSAEALKILTKKPAKQTVFISSELSRHGLLTNGAKAYGWDLNGESFINTEVVKVESIPDSDWIFFSSPSSVSLFPDLDLLDERKIGAMGEGTAAVLADLGFHIDYTGTGVTTEETAAEFALFAGGDKVLFPHSDISLQRVQALVKDELEVINLNTYTTKARTDMGLRTEETIIFTSPSNASAYLAVHKIGDGQKVIAIGPTTGDTLNEAGIAHAVARKTNDIALIDALTTYTF